MGERDKMKVIEANCTNCCKRERFELIEKNRYKCTCCNTIMHKCKSKRCNNMIKHGLFCSKCVGDGFKNGGSLAVGVAAIVVGSAFGINIKKKS